jgi:probable F420-dependent oxidoreductase
MISNAAQAGPESSLRFGIYLPNVGWESLPGPSELVDYAVAAEQMGFDSVWVEDRFLHPRLGILEALTTLTFVASRTERIRLGTCILLVNLRNPLQLAKSISTLDYLSGGRVVVGASLGGNPDEYRVAGYQMKSRVTRFMETIRAMRALWGEGSSDHESRFFQPTDLPMEPKPVQKCIPVWIGGKVEPVFHRVATLGDGWLASSTTDAESFARGWDKVREQALAAGRDPQSLVPAKFSYIHIEDSTEKALAILSERLPRYYSTPYDVARLTLHGPPARCVEQAKKLLEAGVKTLIFSTVTNNRTQLERLSHEVLPHLST